MRTQLIGNGLLAARVPEALAAVLAAFQLQGADAEELLSRDDAGWREVLLLCDRMQLTLPLALRSSRRFPSWVSERLMENLADTARRFVRVQAAYREAAGALASADVPQLVLKGFTQSPDYVKAPQFRMQGDIDFYTPREKVRGAVEALEAIGYEPAGPAEDYRHADHPPTLIRFRGWKRGPNLFDPEMPLALEVHHCLWNSEESLIRIPEVDDFWKRRVDRELGGLSFTSLHRVDQLGYFALHLLRDTFGGQRVVHHALELATFLHERADDTVFWKAWEALHSPRLRQIQAVAFMLAGSAFSSRLPDAVHEQIERLPAEKRVWVEMCGGTLLAETYPRNRDGRLLQFLLSESQGARRRVLWKAMSPGAIASPRKVASSPEHPAPGRGKQRGFWRYPAYLASRISFNSAAVLRFMANGLIVLGSSLAGRREARSQYTGFAAGG
jgi:hypothetical protein